MIESYLIELGTMISRLEHNLKLKPITASERKHYLENHYGDSFIKDLRKHHTMLVEGKGNNIMGPDIIDYDKQSQPTSYDGGGAAEGEQRKMTYRDLV